MNMNEEQNAEHIDQRREHLTYTLIDMIEKHDVENFKNVLRGISPQEGSSLILDFHLVHGVCLAYISIRLANNACLGVHESLREECTNLIVYVCGVFERPEHPITMVRATEEQSLLDLAVLTRNHELIRVLFERADNNTYYNMEQDEIQLSSPVQESIRNFVFKDEDENKTLLREEMVYMEKLYTLTITHGEIRFPTAHGTKKAAIDFISRVIRSKVLHQKMQEVARINDIKTKEILNARISMIISALLTRFGLRPTNIVDNDGNRLVHLSIASENVDATRALLKANVSVDRKNKLQQTPLHVSLAVGNEEIFEMLMQRGVDFEWVENPKTREIVPNVMAFHERPGFAEIARRVCQNQSSLLFSKVREFEEMVDGLLHSSEFATFSTTREKNKEKTHVMKLTNAQVKDPFNSYALAFFPIKWDFVNQCTILDETITFEKAPEVLDNNGRYRRMRDLAEFFEKLPRGIFFKFNSQLVNKFRFHIVDGKTIFDFVAVAYIRFPSITRKANRGWRKQCGNGQMPSSSNGIY